MQDFTVTDFDLSDNQTVKFIPKFHKPYMVGLLTCKSEDNKCDTINIDVQPDFNLDNLRYDETEISLVNLKASKELDLVFDW